MDKLRWVGAFGVCLAALPNLAAANLLANGGFETVPDGSLGQGILPSNWYAASSVVPGADTYSDDNSYGLGPADYGPINFAGVSAHGGKRFVAGWSALGGEDIGQTLGASLVAGQQYMVSAYLQASSRYPTAGGYDVQLRNGSSTTTVGSLLATGNPVDGWQLASITFTADASAGSYSEFAFHPVDDGTGSAYFGLDDASMTAVPEPFSIASVGLGLFAYARRRRS